VRRPTRATATLLVNWGVEKKEEEEQEGRSRSRRRRRTRKKKKKKKGEFGIQTVWTPLGYTTGGESLKGIEIKPRQAVKRSSSD
jgi:hypothetical protein